MAPHDTELDAMLDPELRALDAVLQRALAAPAPPVRVLDRIGQLAEAELSAAGRLRELRQALRVSVPADLPLRIFEATADQIGNATIRREHFRWWALRAAAAVTLLGSITAAVLVYQSKVERERLAWADLMLVDITLREWARDADLAGPAMVELDGRALALALDIDRLAWAVHSESLADLYDESVDQLHHELLMLEVQSHVF